MSKVIYKDLSYVITGIFYEVYNFLGKGYREKTYCETIKKLLDKNNVKYKYQVKIPIMFYNEKVGKRYIDFVIEDKIVVEIKITNNPAHQWFEQTQEYLNLSGHKLGLLVCFRDKDVKVYRVLNEY